MAKKRGLRPGPAVVGAAAFFACVPAARAEEAAPPIDPLTKLQLFAAPFAANETPPVARKAAAMAFLPGRGVIVWDVAGKTAAETKEAQIEAMGLADARAVQREIDAAATERDAEVEAERSARLSFAGGQARSGLKLPTAVGADRTAGAAVALNRAARGGDPLGVKSGDTVKGKPRMYAFASVSGRSVGLNVLHEEAGWRNGGLTTDRDGLAGQRQAGLAWRKGTVQTSLSYVQQKDKLQTLGVQSEKDHRVMLTLAMPPQAVLALFSKKN